MFNKENILADLALIKDEPAQDLMFGFEKLATQLFNVITNEKTNTPFVIAVHGEWGSGKTSLINAVYDKTKKLIDEGNTKLKTLKFDVWEYERTDIVVALLQKISTEYNSTTKKFGVSVSSLIADVMLRKTVGMSTDDVKKHFMKLVEQIPTIKKDLEDLTKNDRLIVFVDDLDRCNIENILDMLEAIKMFFTAKGVIFVVAVDMNKIERVWQLRYNNELAVTEGRDHIEKIFQLNLSLPFKHDADIDKFVSLLCRRSLMNSDGKKLLVSGCKRNPRKIKRILNLVYFTVLGLPEHMDSEYEVDLAISWCVLATSFTEFAKQVKDDPLLLFLTSFACCLFKDLDTLTDSHNMANLGHEIRTRADIKDGEILVTPLDDSVKKQPKPTTESVKLVQFLLGDSVKKQLESIAESADSELFQFLRIFGQSYGFEDNWSRINEDLAKYLNYRKNFFQNIIRRGGFTGI